MSQLKIGIVEDEMIIGESISICLRKLGYEVTPVAHNFNCAVKMIGEELPDLVLIDIDLEEQKDGIDVARFIRGKYSIPIIFLTAHTEHDTLERAKEVNPNAFLVKPFSKDDLYAGIEIAVSNYHSSTKIAEQSMLVKDGYIFVRVMLDQIVFITSERNYVTLHLNNHRKVVVRSTVPEMMDRLTSTYFLRINRSIILNIRYVSRIETKSVFIEDKLFSIAKPQRDQLLSLIEHQIVRTH